MARKPKSTDTAAQMKAADVDQQKQEQSSTDVGNQVERTPTASELAADHPEIFGEETASSKDALDDPKTPQDRQPVTNFATADQVHAAKEGEPLNKPAKGLDIELGDRVMLTTANPIGGQTVNPAFVIGFSPITGNPNLRLELIDGAATRPVEFGNVPKDKEIEERGPFWTKPIDTEKLEEAKADIEDEAK